MWSNVTLVVAGTCGGETIPNPRPRVPFSKQVPVPVVGTGPARAR